MIRTHVSIQDLCDVSIKNKIDLKKITHVNSINNMKTNDIYL